MEKWKVSVEGNHMRENHITCFPFPFFVFTASYESLNTDLEFFWLLNGQNANNAVNCGFPVKVSAHWVRNFRMLKNKYDLTLCQSRLRTASETFVRQKNFGSGSIFCIFASVACILIGKDEEYGKTHAKISDSVCNGLKLMTFSHNGTDSVLW